MGKEVVFVGWPDEHRLSGGVRSGESVDNADAFLEVEGPVLVGSPDPEDATERDDPFDADHGSVVGVDVVSFQILLELAGGIGDRITGRNCGGDILPVDGDFEAFDFLRIALPDVVRFIDFGIITVEESLRFGLAEHGLPFRHGSHGVVVGLLSSAVIDMRGFGVAGYKYGTTVDGGGEEEIGILGQDCSRGAR